EGAHLRRRIGRRDAQRGGGGAGRGDLQVEVGDAQLAACSLEGGGVEGPPDEAGRVPGAGGGGEGAGGGAGGGGAPRILGGGGGAGGRGRRGGPGRRRGGRRGGGRSGWERGVRG